MKCTQIKYALLMLTALPLVALVSGQRAGYAGARPSGLSQKDKYFNTVIGGGAAANGSGLVSFDTRFGQTPPTVNTLPFGAPQRPPVGAFVQPQSGFVPLAGQAAVTGGAPQQTTAFGPAFATGGTQQAALPAATPTVQQQQPQPTGTIDFGSRVGEDNTLTSNDGSISGVAASAAAAGPAPLTPVAQQPLPMPLDAGGDRVLIEQLSRLPQDLQPFWFLNYQAIEAQRNGTGSNFVGGIAQRGSFQG